MLKYMIEIRYSDEDNCYIACVPELDSCMAHGDTPEEALREITIAQNLWLKSAKEVGLKIPEPALYAS